MFSGELPQHPCHNNNLVELNLDNNLLNGEIPGIIYNILDYSECTKLQSLMIGKNSLYGTIPNTIFSLPELTHLSIRETRISGEIPDLSLLKKINNLLLDYNQLTGSIPSNINLLTTLKNLKLNNNDLSGNIPDSLSNLKLIKYM